MRMIAFLIGTTAFVMVGCGGGAANKAADKPRRPVAKSGPTADRDCQPTTTDTSPPAKGLDERVGPEANNLAKEGTTKLRAAIKAGAAGKDLYEEAVRTLITALAADPYNVHAIYNLAAAYARQRMDQCVFNLMARLADLNKLESFRPAIAQKADRLFGRRGRANDPDFPIGLRRTATFRKLAPKLQ